MRRDLNGPILLTGGRGFIGSALARKLAFAGYGVKIFDRVEGLDVTRINDVLQAANGCGAIFNLAGMLGTHELNYPNQMVNSVGVNIVGALNCLNAAKTFNIPILQITKPNLWINTYTITKHAAEQFAKLYAQELGVKVWLPRLFNVFGPGQHYGVPQKLAPTVIVNALNDWPITIYGSGQQTVDHIFVEDAATAMIAIFESDRLIGEVVDVGSGISMTVQEFLDRVIAKTDSKSDIRFVPMRSGETEGNDIRANLFLLKRFAGHPGSYFDFENALDVTIEWYARNRSWE